MAEIPLGVLVEERVITLNKSRQSAIGITLEGNHLPRIINTRLADLENGDIVDTINGKPCKGAVKTATAIKRSRQVQLHVWRPIGRPSRQPVVAEAVVAAATSELSQSPVVAVSVVAAARAELLGPSGLPVRQQL
jgi:hypothetical protein